VFLRSGGHPRDGRLAASHPARVAGVAIAAAGALAGAIRKLESDLGITFNEEEKRDDTRAAKRVLAELETRARQGAEACVGESDPPQPRALLLFDNIDDSALLRPPQSDLIFYSSWKKFLRDQHDIRACVIVGTT
jgi:hypothetical protein